MQSTGNFLKVITVFDKSSDSAQSVFHSNLIRSVLRKVLPRDVLLGISEDERVNTHFWQEVLPVLKAEVWGDTPYYLSLQVICPFQAHAAKFFQEMVSRWLLPGAKLTLESFFSSKFSVPELYEGDLLFADAVVPLQSDKDLERIRRNLLVLENEIFLGLSSYYQAGRILEVKGISSNEKNAIVQETLSLLVQKRSNYFDYDVFSLMQQFFLICREEFKQARECFHLSRIVYTIYLFKKALSSLAEQLPGQRHVSVKVCKLRLHLPFTTKRVLGLFVGVNFLHKNEVFDEHHLMKSIDNYLPGVKLVEDSSFIIPGVDEKVQVVYLEIEKVDGREFRVEDVQVLRQKLPSDLKNHVEKLMPAVFMPRNEEEVMKNILVLSHELRYFRDLPQVIISFEEQADMDLTFTVIFLRLLTDKESMTIEESYRSRGGRFLFAEDRVKRVGMLRGKYPKEATVFRLSLPKDMFLREDHTLDLLKARQEVVFELHQILGEFRDYNGGMIAKQSETLLGLKKQVGEIDKKDELLLENFFHALMPMEARNVVAVSSLKSLFLLLQECIKNEGFEEGQTRDPSCYCLVAKSREFFSKEEIAGCVKRLGLSSCQLITALVHHESYHYFCSLLLVDEQSFCEKWYEAVHRIKEGTLQSCPLV